MALKDVKDGVTWCFWTVWTVPRVNALIHFLTHSCDQISCCGKPVERTSEIDLEWFHRSARLATHSDWSDRTTESESGSKLLRMTWSGLRWSKLQLVYTQPEPRGRSATVGKGIRPSDRLTDWLDPVISRESVFWWGSKSTEVCCSLCLPYSVHLQQFEDWNFVGERSEKKQKKLLTWQILCGATGTGKIPGSWMISPPLSVRFIMIAVVITVIIIIILSIFIFTLIFDCL